MATTGTSAIMKLDESDTRKQLGGRWRNQFGSILELVVDCDGGLTGWFVSATGATAGATYPIRGCCDVSKSGPRTVVGFVVDWGVHHASTAWSGSYDAEKDTIRASWLMTTSTDEKEDWRSTLIGHDVFHRPA
jgi:hypothetical protein